MKMKASDLMDFDFFIFKLLNFGIKGGTFHWIDSYLLNRELCARIRVNFSDTLLANCGIPEISHLGPLLLILFIIDITSESKFV